VIFTRVIAGFSVMLCASCLAQEHAHGTEKLGAVRFVTSCNEPAQNDFSRAVALLHSFQFGRAIEGFTQTSKEDPTCGIAYWGIALSDWSNPFAAGMKDKGQLQAGTRGRGAWHCSWGQDRGRTGLSCSRGQVVQKLRDYVAAIAPHGLSRCDAGSGRQIPG